jgi:hypothetical protein
LLYSSEEYGESVPEGASVALIEGVVIVGLFKAGENTHFPAEAFHFVPGVSPEGGVQH